MNNSNLYRIVIIAVCLSLLASCGDLNFPSDGFKSVKFEMNAHQLESIGFSCESDKLSCEKKADEKKQPTIAKLYLVSLQISMWNWWTTKFQVLKSWYA